MWAYSTSAGKEHLLALPTSPREPISCSPQLFASCKDWLCCSFHFNDQLQCFNCGYTSLFFCLVFIIVCRLIWYHGQLSVHLTRNGANVVILCPNLIHTLPVLDGGTSARVSIYFAYLLVGSTHMVVSEA